MNYEAEIKLLKLFEEFQNQNNTNDIEEFGVWLFSKNNLMKEKLESQDLEENVNGYIGMFLGFMGKYANFYARRIFRDSDIYSIDDYVILLTLLDDSLKSKSEAIKENLLEKSYGIEVIKRLLKQGFIMEVESDQDKRVKLLKITPAGMQQVKKHNKNTIALSNHVVGKLSYSDKSTLLKILQHLNQFHEPYFDPKKEGEISKLLKVETRA